MKKYMIMAMTAALFSSCLSDGNEDDNGGGTTPDNARVEIKGSAGVFEIHTRAPVNTGSAIVANFVASATPGDYSTTLWNATGSFSASETASPAFSFNAPQYYPVNGNTVNIKGYYPAGTLSNNTVTFTETDGSNDVMITSEVSGSKATSAPLAFTFNHLLTQLQFTFVAGTGYPQSGKNVTSIAIKNQQTPASLNISAGTVSYNAAATFTLTGTFSITGTTGTLAAIYPMVKSGATSVVLGITADGVTYNDVTVNLTTETAKAHNIILTFTPKEITATAMVTPWVPGGSSSTIVQ